MWRGYPLGVVLTLERQASETQLQGAEAGGKVQARTQESGTPPERLRAQAERVDG
jgi:hypothetical protein